MSAATPTVCAACGTAASGNFCSRCGAALGPRRCTGCGSELSPGAKFCRRCGTASVVGARPASSRVPLAAAAGGALLLAILLVALMRGNRAAPGPDGPEVEGPAAAAGGPPGAPPDISAMSPRERFDRLYNRIMRAAESGDDATVGRFTPMALLAYAQLPSLDADARYHAALIQVHTGNVGAAQALADTILADTPGHLFGYLIAGTVARWRQDTAGAARAYAAFLDHYDAELAAGRPEYGEHKRALDEFRQTALEARKAAGSPPRRTRS
jgi:ribosomal protein L40E